MQFDIIKLTHAQLDDVVRCHVASCGMDIEKLTEAVVEVIENAGKKMSVKA